MIYRHVLDLLLILKISTVIAHLFFYKDMNAPACKSPDYRIDDNLKYMPQHEEYVFDDDFTQILNV